MTNEPTLRDLDTLRASSRELRREAAKLLMQAQQITADDQPDWMAVAALAAMSQAYTALAATAPINSASVISRSAS